jgi:hypothetical protein
MCDVRFRTLPLWYTSLTLLSADSYHRRTMWRVLHLIFVSIFSLASMFVVLCEIECNFDAGSHHGTITHSAAHQHDSMEQTGNCSQSIQDRDDCGDHGTAEMFFLSKPTVPFSFVPSPPSLHRIVVSELDSSFSIGPPAVTVFSPPPLVFSSILRV